MKKYFLLACILICLCAALLMLPWGKHQPTATIKGHIFSAEIAKTPQQQEIGLAKYNTIQNNFVMYFPFDHPDYYAFWMKNMHFSIDILFLQNGKIITLYQNVPAPRPNQTELPVYKPTGPSNGVVEISAGLSKKYGFTVGDTVNLQR